MRNRAEIWKNLKEFLLKEYEVSWYPLVETHNRCESWFKFYIAILTLTGGIIGLIIRIDGVDKLGEEFWWMLSGFLITLFIFGIGTLLVAYRGRISIVEYLNAINWIREFFVEGTEKIEPKFEEYVFLKKGTQRYLKRFSTNLIMIYILSILNFLTFIGLLVIFVEKLDWINMRINIIVVNGQLSSIIIIVTVSLLINFSLLLMVIHYLFKKDKKYITKELSK